MNLKFLQSPKLISYLLILSILSLVVGAALVLRSRSAEQQQATMAAMNHIAVAANNQLQQTKISTGAPIKDFAPETSVAKVAALNGAQPELGSDDWCEVMMVKPSNDWTAEEQQLFAKQCI